MSRPPKKSRQNLVGQVAVAILVMVGFFWFMQDGEGADPGHGTARLRKPVSPSAQPSRHGSDRPAGVAAGAGT
jgi:hypothetical protein